MALIDQILTAAGVSSGNMGTATNALGALGGFGASELGIQRLGDLQQDIESQASQYATRGQQASAFQPFAVTTPRGTAQIGAQGGLTLTPEEGLAPQVADLSMQQALSALQQPTPTAQGLFQQMQAVTAPEEQRRRLELENRLAAQGRLGTQTAAYGGTPEALALEKAIQEQQAQNLLSAQTLAPQLAQQQAGLGSSLFGLGAQAQVQPMQGLLAALTPSLEAARLAQAGRASEAQILGQLGPEVLESYGTLGKEEAGLRTAQLNALLQALGLGQTSQALQQGASQAATTATQNTLSNLLQGTGVTIPNIQGTVTAQTGPGTYFPDQGMGGIT